MPASTHLRLDCAAAVAEYAAKHDLSISGAIHKLLRTHPLIDLGDIQ